ncbi:MAG: adenylate kinase [Flavobacteriaceae bacterium]
MIQLHDKTFVPFISEKTIATAIKKMAHDVATDLEDEVPIFIGVLNGAFMVVSDLMRAYPGNCEVSFVKMASYEGIASTGKVSELIGINEKLDGRTVILVEDIVDTGNTLEALHAIFSKQKTKALKTATLFFKPEAYKKNLKLDYIGIEIPNKFIVGYGLDYDGLGRNLPKVYQLKTQKMTNIILFGPPGAGKGTQADVLKDTYNLVHISTGDVFRYNIKNKTELGLSAKSYIDKGQLVPDEVTINMLKAEVEKNEGANGFIFDGFPRTEAQAKALDKLLDSKGTQVNGMVALEVDDEVLVKRLLERGKTSGRPDDADESIIRNRIEVYYDETAILKGYYQKQDKYFGVDGEGSIEEITERLNNVINAL